MKKFLLFNTTPIITGQIWDPAKTNSVITLSADRLTANTTATNTNAYRGSMGLYGYSANTVYYFEVVKNSAGYNEFGLAKSGAASAVLAGTYYIGSTDTNSCGYWDYQGLYNGGTPQFTPPPTQTSATLMCAFNPSTGRIWFGSNGTWFNSGNPATNTNPAITGFSGTLYPIISVYNATGVNPNTMVAHFTSASWTYPSSATGCIAMT